MKQTGIALLILICNSISGMNNEASQSLHSSQLALSFSTPANNEFYTRIQERHNEETYQSQVSSLRLALGRTALYAIATGITAAGSLYLICTPSYEPSSSRIPSIGMLGATSVFFASQAVQAAKKVKEQLRGIKQK